VLQQLEFILAVIESRGCRSRTPKIGVGAEITSRGSSDSGEEGDSIDEEIGGEIAEGCVFKVSKTCVTSASLRSSSLETATRG
jgi:hypothetical protein